MSAGAGLTSQRYDLLLAIKTGENETSTVSELVTKSFAAAAGGNRACEAGRGGGSARRSVGADRRVSVLRLTAEADRRLMRAFLALREERRQLARGMRAVDASFRASAVGGNEVGK